jgi:Transposase DDE domain/Transposase domain (DUF772)
MTLGMAERQGDLLDDVNRFCEQMLPESSLFVVLHRERDRLFPDEMFADLFSDRGRRSVPPSVVATVMVLQRLEGLSDREAVERYCFDTRWRYACGVGGYDGDGWVSFAHTVLVDMRARLKASTDPRRLFRVVLDAASAAGLVGVKRVLDSTPLYDAVATMDTITLIRSAIRALLKVADPALAASLRAVLTSGDDYLSLSKPQIDWEDATGREQLIDSRATDGFACLRVLEGRKLNPAVTEAAELLATVLGQDLEQTEGGDGQPGVFWIARRVAKDRVISTVDPQARHGHKSVARGFDGYKGHLAIDPDSEIVTDTVVSAGNVGDASVAADLIKDLTEDVTEQDLGSPPEPTATVYGDSAYGSSGQFLDDLAEAGVESRCKTQPPTAAGGMFTKDAFDVDLDADTVTCPNQVTAPIRRDKHGDGSASFGPACADCPLRAACTKATGGRSVMVGRYEQRLAEARTAQKNPAWREDYRATRPKVERKLGHLMHRKHGGRRARMRGQAKIDADFNLLAAAHNIARLAVLGIRSTPRGWATAPA